ncbi:MAG: RES family NAD+ phosphorylase [Gemmatimonadota bacterium]
MTSTAWRIVKTNQARTAFSGEAARANGGRWNSPGTAIVYASWTASLALLEILVHLEGSGMLEAFSLIPIEFDEGDVEVLDDAALPADWRAQPAPVSTQRIGDRWTVERRSAVLRIPSVIVANESNYLLNPGHPRFREIAVGKPRRFPLDRRPIS